MKLQDQLRERQRELNRRREVNQACRALLNASIDENILQQRSRLNQIESPRQADSRRQLNQKRSELIGHLSTIYPIEPISSGDDPLLFSIAQIILPNLEPNQPIASSLINSNNFKSSSLLLSTSNPVTSLSKPTAGFLQLFKPFDLADDDRIVSTALGFVSHLTKLLSIYLAIPLPYPLSLIGSRSLVSDFVSRISGPRSFPLYFKGVDRFRFEYAVFLLNKNIERIMYHQKVVVSDLRHTLPNLKNLLLTLESNPTTLMGENEINSSMIDLVYPQAQETLSFAAPPSSTASDIPTRTTPTRNRSSSFRRNSSPSSSSSSSTPGFVPKLNGRSVSTQGPSILLEDDPSSSLSPASSSSIDSLSRSDRDDPQTSLPQSHPHSHAHRHPHPHSHDRHHHSRHSSHQSEKTLKL